MWVFGQARGALNTKINNNCLTIKNGILLREKIKHLGASSWQNINKNLRGKNIENLFNFVNHWERIIRNHIITQQSLIAVSDLTVEVIININFSRLEIVVPDYALNSGKSKQWQEASKTLMWIYFKKRTSIITPTIPWPPGYMPGNQHIHTRVIIWNYYFDQLQLFHIYILKRYIHRNILPNSSACTLPAGVSSPPHFRIRTSEGSIGISAQINSAIKN